MGLEGPLIGGASKERGGVRGHSASGGGWRGELQWRYGERGHHLCMAVNRYIIFQ